MCGRFTLRVSVAQIAEEFDLLVGPELLPRYNVAPTQDVAIVRAAAEAPQQRQLALVRWGLVPSWATDPKIGNRLINARAESLTEKPAFRAAFRRRRCLIVGDGFYEWQRQGRQKQPYFFQRPGGRPIGFAGLWETWQSPEDQVIESCTMITTQANGLVQPIHDRMPAIIAKAEYGTWLNPSIEEPERLLPLLRPLADAELESHAVSTRVNSPKDDDPDCIAPMGGQSTLF